VPWPTAPPPRPRKSRPDRRLDPARGEQTTQQNAALVEEAAAATTALREQAAALAGLMTMFETSAPAPHSAGFQAGSYRTSRLELPAA
jgi:methyl-accepting chemotaxis protein